MSNPMVDKKIMEEMLEDLRKQIGMEQWAFIVHSAQFDPATYGLAGNRLPDVKALGIRYLLMVALVSTLDLVAKAKALWKKYVKRKKLWVDVKQKTMTQNPDGTINIQTTVKKIKKYPDADAKAKHFAKCTVQLLRRAKVFKNILDTLSTPVMGFYQKPPNVILTNEGIAKKDSYFFTGDKFAKIKNEVETIVGRMNPAVSSGEALSGVTKSEIESLRRQIDARKDEMKLLSTPEEEWEKELEMEKTESTEKTENKEESKEKEGKEEKSEEPEVEFK